MSDSQRMAQRLACIRYVRKIGLKENVHWYTDDDGFVYIKASIATETAVNKYLFEHPDFAKRAMQEFRKLGFTGPRIVQGLGERWQRTTVVRNTSSKSLTG